MIQPPGWFANANLSPCEMIPNLIQQLELSMELETWEIPCGCTMIMRLGATKSACGMGIVPRSFVKVNRGSTNFEGEVSVPKGPSRVSCKGKVFQHDIPYTQKVHICSSMKQYFVIPYHTSMSLSMITYMWACIERVPFCHIVIILWWVARIGYLFYLMLAV